MICYAGIIYQQNLMIPNEIDHVHALKLTISATLKCCSIGPIGLRNFKKQASLKWPQLVLNHSLFLKLAVTTKSCSDKTPNSPKKWSIQLLFEKL